MSVYTIVMSVITIVCSLYVIFSVLRRTIAKDVDQKFEKVDFVKPVIDMILTVTAVVSFVIAIIEFLKKK